MSYATLSDLIARFGEREIVDLTDRTGVGAVDEAIAQAALDEAASMIDGYLRDRYALPVAAPVPAVLARIACDLARFYLAAERATEEMRDRHDAARRLLADIASGRVRLGIAAPDPLTDGLAAAKAGPAAVMSREETSGY